MLGCHCSFTYNFYTDQSVWYSCHFCDFNYELLVDYNSNSVDPWTYGEDQIVSTSLVSGTVAAPSCHLHTQDIHFSSLDYVPSVLFLPAMMPMFQVQSLNTCSFSHNLSFCCGTLCILVTVTVGRSCGLSTTYAVALAVDLGTLSQLRNPIEGWMSEGWQFLLAASYDRRLIFWVNSSPEIHTGHILAVH